MTEGKTRKRRFAQVDHLMTRDKRFRGVDEPLACWLLAYLYLSPSNSNGLVHESLDEIAEYSRIPRDELPDLFKLLESIGRVKHKGMDIVLMDWREWMGGHKHKDADGFIKVTKEIVDTVRLDRQTLDDEIFTTYVHASGFESSDLMYEVLDQPDNRGGDRRSKANQNPIKSESKPDQKTTKGFDRVLTDLDIDIDSELDEDEEMENSSSSKTEKKKDCTLLPEEMNPANSSSGKPSGIEAGSDSEQEELLILANKVANGFAERFLSYKCLDDDFYEANREKLLKVARVVKHLHSRANKNKGSRKETKVGTIIGFVMDALEKYRDERFPEKKVHLGNLASPKFLSEYLPQEMKKYV